MDCAPDQLFEGGFAAVNLFTLNRQVLFWQVRMSHRMTSQVDEISGSQSRQFPGRQRPVGRSSLAGNPRTILGARPLLPFAVPRAGGAGECVSFGTTRGGDPGGVPLPARHVPVGAELIFGILRRSVKVPMMGVSTDLHIQVLRQRARQEEDFLEFIPPKLTSAVDLAGGDE